MAWRWWRQRRRKRILRQPFNAEWHTILRENSYLYRQLTQEEQARVRDYVQIFVAEKYWEGCGGMVITDEVRVTVAAQVAVLVLGLHEEFFNRVLSILVYPQAYVSREQTMTPTGMVLEGVVASEGEAWYRGPIVLSWEDVLAGSKDESGGDNLVLHEFAHQLDMLNGSADGIPPLRSREHDRQWVEVMNQVHKRLVRDCERGAPTVLDCYATSHHSELFSVATEAFFHQPLALRQSHAELYALLRTYYRQDPASR